MTGELSANAAAERDSLLFLTLLKVRLTLEPLSPAD